MVIPKANGSHRFRIFLPAADSVTLVGDFTAWNANGIPMNPDGDGWWQAEMEVKPGDHEFSYCVDGWRYLADFAANGVRRNEFGNWVSLLSVTPRREAAAAA